MGSFNIESARSNFPALQQSDRVFGDNAGGSQTLGSVIKSIITYLSETNVQLGASYAVGLKSTAKYNAGYEAAAKYINASVNEIVLGSSTTQLLRNLSSSFKFPVGSELIVSKIDHEANIAPWIALAKQQSLVLKWWTPKTKENPILLASDLAELLSERTVLVTCTHASNLLGTIHDIKAISDAVHTIPGAMLVVDGVSLAPHRQIDVKALGADFYTFSWYKVYGPHLAILYSSPLGFDAVTSLGHYFNPSKTLANKLEFAGASYELVASLPSILDYFGPSLAESWKVIAKHEAILQSALLKYLKSRADVTIYGEKEADPIKRVSTISFTLKGIRSEDLVTRVDRATEGRIGIRWGTFYSVRLAVETLGLGYDGVIRVSLVHYNTLEEVNELTALLDRVLST